MILEEFINTLNSCSCDGVFRAYDALIRLTDCKEEEFKLYLSPRFKKHEEELQEFYFYYGLSYSLEWTLAVRPFIEFYISSFKPSFSVTEVYIAIEVRRRMLNR